MILGLPKLVTADCARQDRLNVSFPRDLMKLLDKGLWLHYKPVKRYKRLEAIHAIA
jgi:hypothetical protein